MTIVSIWFLGFLLIGLLIYYLVPSKVQWIVLLLMSIGFYAAAATPYTIIYPVFSMLIAYGATRLIVYARSKGAQQKRICLIAPIAILLVSLIWFLLKGSSYWVTGSVLLKKVFPSFPKLKSLSLIAAMGMGYYTAQVIGYILDVYWERTEVQKNPLKLFLFVSFFAQLICGPISRHEDLKSLYKPHRFSYENLCYGSQRILWGFFKKLVISGRIALIVNGIWANTGVFHGAWAWAAVLLYPLQLYTDFSGCMDIVIGAAELFDIHLAENFKNPFFSRNSQEFWQRWHMTLGAWARDYVFYPFMKSQWMVRLGKNCRAKFGKRGGKLIVWSIATAVLWFVMGFWHGSYQHIFGVSLWFWGVLLISELLSPLNNKATSALKIKTEGFGWHLFQSVRTYFIYALGAVWFAASGLRDAVRHFRLLLTGVLHPNLRSVTYTTLVKTGVTWRDLVIIFAGLLLLLLVGILREKHGYARLWIKDRPLPLRWTVWLLLLISVILFGMYGSGFEMTSFIYQGF